MRRIQRKRQWWYYWVDCDWLLALAAQINLFHNGHEQTILNVFQRDSNVTKATHIHLSLYYYLIPARGSVISRFCILFHSKRSLDTILKVLALKHIKLPTISAEICGH